MQRRNHYLLTTLFICGILLFNGKIKAQMNIEGDFQVRWYSDSFQDTRDNRGKENYMRYLGRVRNLFKVSDEVTFNSELTTVIQNRVPTVRNIVGTGNMQYSITQMYAEVTKPNFLIFDVMRLRAGRQPFGVGSGLSFGESYYYLNKFDGARVDLAYGDIALTLFGAITGQNLSESGIYPEPGSDQIYTARLSTSLFEQNIMGYYILQKPRGSFNDNQIFGLGATGSFLNNRLEYFGEFAYQKFNTPDGLPQKAGIGYMGGIGYRFSWGPFRSIKVETRYAAYQGDDASTEKKEIFSPAYPNFFWGDRTGYANGEIGGTYPNNGRNPEGSKIWYSRIYFIPKVLPDLRIQFQYVNVKEYIDNDGYNSKDNEFSTRLYYKISNNTQIEFRYTRGIPNEEDKDLNNNGSITSTEDRFSFNRIMLQLQLNF